MRIANDGIKAALISSGESVTLISNQHLTHYDVFVTTPQRIIAEFYAFVDMQSPIAGSVTDDLDQHLANANKRLNTLLELVKSGCDLIIFISGVFPSVSVREMQINEYDSIWCLEGVRLKTLRGSGAVYVGPSEPGLEELNKRIQWVYDAEIVASDAVAILKTESRLASHAKVVAAVRKVGKGHLILAPHPPLSKNEKASVNGAADAPINFLRNAAALVQPPTNYPAWAAQYALSALSEAPQRIGQLKSKIVELEEELSERELAWAAWYWTRDLLFADNLRLELAILKAIEMIGVASVPGPAGRADALVRIGDVVLVIEAKGHIGAAKELAVNQCNQWVAETITYLEDRDAVADDVMAQYVVALDKLGCYDQTGQALHEVQVKGMVICNTYRETPLGDRPDMVTQMAQHFPTPVQNKLTHRAFVGLTTVQLLALVNLKQAGSTVELDEAMKALCMTDGVFSMFRSWKDYIEPI